MTGLKHLLVLSVLAGCVCARDDPTITTNAGKLSGTWGKSRNGQDYMAFRGIPYARVPVLRNRFKPPYLLTDWGNGTLWAKHFSPLCMQYIEWPVLNPIVGSEDCLSLNIYTKNVTGNAPVLFYIHGGGYKMGSARVGPQFMMDEDLVVVTVNYRLGVFGFLSLESDLLPGNMGMKDQVVALKWVQNNIKSFGGNPNLVTLIGDSAGAASVYLHLISPLSKGLFHRAVAESGSAYTPWAVAPPGYAKSMGQKLLRFLECPTSSSSDALNCISKKTSEEIVRVTPLLSEPNSMDPIVTLGPTLESTNVEGAFLNGPVKDWKNSPVPLIMGFTSGEGLMKIFDFVVHNRSFRDISDSFDKMAPISMMYQWTASNPANITKELRKYYFSDQRITEENWRNLTDMYTDGLISVGVIDGANKHIEDGGKVYVYYFDYNLTTKVTPIPSGFEKFMFGPNHCEEGVLLWMSDKANLTRDETETSKALIKGLAEFARTGVPSIPEEHIYLFEWTKTSHKVFRLHNRGFYFPTNPVQDRYNFWKSLNYMDNYDRPAPSSANTLLTTGMVSLIFISTFLNYLSSS